MQRFSTLAVGSKVCIAHDVFHAYLLNRVFLCGSCQTELQYGDPDREKDFDVQEYVRSMGGINPNKVDTSIYAGVSAELRK